MSSSPMTCKHALGLMLGTFGAPTPEDARQARLHASRCPRCSSAYDPVGDARGVTELNPEAAPVLRIGLIAIALAQLVFATPWLIGHSMLPDAHVAVSHLTRDGALGLVIAALGLVTAWRPRYVHGTMIIGLCVFATQVAAGLADQRTSSVSPSFEIVHLLLVVIVFGMFVVAADVARRATPQLEPRSPIVRSRSYLS